jgi:hypothetical protein
MRLNVRSAALIKRVETREAGPTNEDQDKGRDWAARVVLDIADPVLGSPEIRQALDQVQVTEESMRSILSDHVDDLICSGASINWNFVAPINWDWILRWGPPLWFAPAALIVLGGFVACLVIFIGWIATLAVLVGSSYLAVLATLFVLTRPSLRDRLAPTAETSDDMRRRVVGPFLRERLNQLLDKQDYPVELRVTTAPGLAELSEREQIVPTDATARLAQLSEAMPTGNLGVSGPRGAGKTTLLRNFCDATLEWRDPSQGVGRSDLRVMVSAPVDYDAREFILYLFGRVCETVLATARASSSGRKRDAYEERRHRSFTVLPGLVLAVAGTAIIGWNLLARARQLPHFTSVDLGFAAGCVLLAGGIGFLVAGAGAAGWRARREEPLTIPDEARMWLTRLGYLQAFTTGYSGTLRLPAGAQLQATTTRQFTELQLALPDLVDRYRDFAARTALWYRSSWPGPTETAGRIVVGIDELDKIGSAETCAHFINDIKAIFGIPHWLYLVSVSDDALVAFEQRAFVARTAFDNAFDEVVHAGYLDFEAACTLLRSRVAGLPSLMIGLCHVLSGGLPRDLIRAARALIDVGAAEGSSHITGLCEEMVAAEMETLKGACLTALAAEPEQLDSTGLLPRLLDSSWPGQSCKALLRALDQDLRHPETPRNFCAGVYFYATVIEVFGPGLTETTHALRTRGTACTTGVSAAHSGGDASIDRLAHARNALSGNPDIAWELVTRFRAARTFTMLVRPWQSGHDIPGDGSIPDPAPGPGALDA